MMQLYWVEAGFLIAAMGVAIGGLAQKASWAYEPWLIPVLAALLWGVLQTKN